MHVCAMYTKILFFLIYIINIMSIYSLEYNITEYYTYDNITDNINNYEYIYRYNESQIRSKSEVLEIEEQYSLGMTFICKNDICTKLDFSYPGKFFIEIPDKNKNIKRYIINSYDYDSIKLHKIRNYRIEPVYNNCSTEEYDNRNFNSCKHYALISSKCTSDSQCLPNKCIDGYCMFNKENPTEFCTFIYSYSIYSGSHSYMHCGKATGDICETNEECASLICSEYGYCNPPKIPSDTDGLLELAQLFYLVCFCILSFMFFVVGRYIINFKKEINNYNQIKCKI